MRPLTILSLLLLLCASSMDSAALGRERQVNQEPTGTAMIAATAFDANDKTLELRYKVVNRSNHDVWICDAIYWPWPDKVFPTDYEVYVEEDARTLVIRRQIEVAAGMETPAAKQYRGRYVVLHPGQERAGSFSLSIPVVRHPMLAWEGPDVDFATRVVLKIGFYDEDLPGKIRRLLDLADRLGFSSAQTAAVRSADFDLYLRYFTGFWLSELFGGLSGFSKFWTEGSEQIDIPYTELVPLGDESCLQITVDGVLIPIEPCKYGGLPGTPH